VPPTLTSAEQSLVDLAAGFGADHVAPNAAAWERDRRAPAEILRAAADAGVLAVEVPEEWGGAGAGYFSKLRVTEELSRFDMGFAFSMINTQNVAARLATQAAPEIAERYVPRLVRAEIFGSSALTEPGRGSDFAAIETVAEKVDGGWRLSGEKAWITNGVHSDVILTYAQTEPGARGRGIAAFVVDAGADGFARLPAYELMGGFSFGISGFTLDRVFVPDAGLLQPPGDGFKKALRSVNEARTYVAAMCCGMVQESLRLALGYLRGREAFGGPLLDKQGLRWLLADVATDLEAARLLTYRAADALESEDDKAAALHAAHAKKFAARVATARILDCMQALGANGLKDEVPLGRHLAAAKMAHYADGTTEIQNERIAALMAGAYGG
jgi:alkylation response protein AidB-like acyl-CoA dehydrogenase